MLVTATKKWGHLWLKIAREVYKPLKRGNNTAFSSLLCVFLYTGLQDQAPLPPPLGFWLKVAWDGGGFLYPTQLGV